MVSSECLKILLNLVPSVGYFPDIWNNELIYYEYTIFKSRDTFDPKLLIHLCKQ